MLDNDDAINTSNEIIQNAESINTSVGDINLLDVIKDAVADKEMLDEPIGLETYKLIRITTDEIKQRHELDSGVRAIANEAFTSKFSAKSINRLAFEDAASMVMDIWNKIKATISKVWSSITDFFAKIFDSNNRLSESAISLKKRVEAKNSDLTPDAKEFDNKGVAKYFPYTRINAGLVKEVIENHKDSIERFNKATDAYNNLVNELDNYITSTGSEGMNQGVVDKFVNTAKEILSDKGKTVFNTTIVVKSNNDAKKLSLSIKFETGKADDNIGCDTLGLDEMSAMCDSVIDLCEENKSLKKSNDKVGASGKKLTKLIDEAMVLAKKEQAEAGKVTSEKQAAARQAKQERESGTKKKTLISTMTGGNSKIDSINKGLDENESKANDEHSSASATSASKDATASKLSNIKTVLPSYITAINKIVSGYPTLNLEAGKGALIYVMASLNEYKERFGGKTKKEAQSSEEE